MSNNMRVSDMDQVDFSDKPLADTDRILLEIAPASDYDNKKISLGQIRKHLINNMYPVGCIYCTTSSKSPADILGVGTWRRYSNDNGSATIFGYKPGDSKWNIASTPKGNTLNHTTVSKRSHWGWVYIGTQNLPSHHHATHGNEKPTIEQSWVRYNDEESKKQGEDVWDKTSDIQISVCSSFGLASSHPMVKKQIIKKRDLGSTTSEIKVTSNSGDNRINPIKINGKNRKVEEQEMCYVRYNNESAKYTYMSVPSMKGKLNSGITNSLKWIDLPDIGSKIGDIDIPGKKSGTGGSKDPDYSPVVNCVTKDNKIRLKNGTTITMTDGDFGKYVEYKDGNGDIAYYVYCKDWEVTEDKNKKISRSLKKKWIPFNDKVTLFNVDHENEYIGTTDTSINGEQTNDKIHKTHTGGYTDTDDSHKVNTTVIAHIGDIAKYNNTNSMWGEYMYTPVTKSENQVVSTTDGSVTTVVKDITKNRWSREDTGFSIIPDTIGTDPSGGKIMFTNVHEQQDGDIIEQISVNEGGSDDKKWHRGNILRPNNPNQTDWEGSGTSAQTTWYNLDYGMVFWPYHGFDVVLMGQIKTRLIVLGELSKAENSSKVSERSQLLAEIYDLIQNDVIEHTGDPNYRFVNAVNFDTELFPVWPGNDADSDTKNEWASHTSDDYRNSKAHKHTPGIIDNWLPPYVVVNRWERIA